MCGLVGCGGAISKKEKDAFKLMLHLDIIRGPHSTGVASVTTNGGWELVKKKGTAWDLFDSKQYDDVMRPTSYALIGHNRYATKGKINAINAHPFEFEDVVGAHNGTITGQWRLPDNAEFEVDSENIFHSIQNQGLEDTLAILDGAYALTYWDKRTDDLVLVRNDKRELSYCYSEDGKTVFWASEQWMLYVALSRNGIKHGEVMEVVADHIYRFSFPTKYVKDGEEVTVSIQKFKPFQTPVTTKSHNPYYQGKGQTPKLEDKSKGDAAKMPRLGETVEFTIDGISTTKFSQDYLSGSVIDDPSIEVRIFVPKDSKLWQELLAEKDDSVFKGKVASVAVDLSAVNINYAMIEQVEEEEEEVDTILGYDNKLLTDQQFLEKTEKGCAWCSGPVGLSQAGSVHWLSSNEYVCSECLETKAVQEFIQAG